MLDHEIRFQASGLVIRKGKGRVGCQVHKDKFISEGQYCPLTVSPKFDDSAIEILIHDNLSICMGHEIVLNIEVKFQGIKVQCHLI